MVAPSAQRTSARASRRIRATPTTAATMASSDTGHHPAVASPTERQKYRATAVGPPSFAPPPPTPTSNRPARTRSVSQNGTPSTSTATPASAASRMRSRRATSTYRPWPPSISTPYGCAATVSSAVATQSAHAPRPPRSSARSSASRHASGEEEEEAVHPPVDAVEEEQPARCDDRRRDEADADVGEPRPERRDERQARDREGGREEPQAAEPEAEMGDRPGEEEVERRAAAVTRDVLDDAGQRVAADEERERLVLVRRPRHQLVEEERGRGDDDAGRSQVRPAQREPGPRGRARNDGRRSLLTCLDPLRHRGFRHLRW